MSGEPVGPLTVTGGVDGVAAHRREVADLAGALEEAGAVVRSAALGTGRALLDPALAASALVAPVSHACVEGLLLAVEAGPDALLVCSGAFEATALGVRGALAALEEADALAARLALAADAALLGPLLPVLPAVGVAGALRPDLAQDVLIAHPGLVDAVVGGAAGLLPTAALGVPGAAGLAAAAYSDAPGRAVRRPDLVVPGGAASSVAGLTDHLAAVAALAHAPGGGVDSGGVDGGGTIEVQTLHGPGGVRHVVYLPGTDDITSLPGRQDADARDLGGDLQLVAGERTAYADGVRAALGAAGVRPGEPVLLVGHSQGGLLAGALLHEGVAVPGGAALLVGAVTLGAPIAHQGAPPAGTTVLALENVHDVVPHLDAAANPPAVGLVTATGDGGGHDVLSAHEYPAYAAVAAAVDASADPSVTAELATLRAQGFLTGGVPATSQVFQVVRDTGGSG